MNKHRSINKTQSNLYRIVFQTTWNFKNYLCLFADHSKVCDSFCVVTITTVGPRVSVCAGVCVHRCYKLPYEQDLVGFLL